MAELAAVQRAVVVQRSEPREAPRRVEADQHHRLRPATGT